MNENLAVALIVIAVVGGCVADTYLRKDERADPVIACVRAAWTNADRIECLKAR